MILYTATIYSSDGFDPSRKGTLLRELRSRLFSAPSGFSFKTAWQKTDGGAEIFFLFAQFENESRYLIFRQSAVFQTFLDTLEQEGFTMEQERLFEDDAMAFEPEE